MNDKDEVKKEQNDLTSDNSELFSKNLAKYKDLYDKQLITEKEYKSVKEKIDQFRVLKTQKFLRSMSNIKKP